MKQTVNWSTKKPGKGRSRYDDEKYMLIPRPKHPVIRYRFLDDRHMALDLRGIRNPTAFFGKPSPVTGDKRRYITPEHMQRIVDEYFESCNGIAFDKWGQPVRDENGNFIRTQVKPYTVSGLAYAIGVKTCTIAEFQKGKLDSLLDELWAKTNDATTFVEVLTRAKQRVEQYSEGRLYDREGVVGAKYVLSVCHKWATSKEQAELARILKDIELRQKEFELKQKLLDEGLEDGDLTINIVRGSKDNG